MDKDLFAKYFNQFQAGCSLVYCENPFCPGNVQLPSAAALAKALQYARDHQGNALCRPPKGLSLPYVKRLIEQYEASEPKNSELLLKIIVETFSSPENLQRSFLTVEAQQNGVFAGPFLLNYPDLLEAFSLLANLEGVNITQAMCNGLSILGSSLEAGVSLTPHMALIIFEVPFTAEGDLQHSFFPSFFAAVSKFTPDERSELAFYWGSSSSDHMQSLIRTVQFFITLRVLEEASEHVKYVPNFDKQVCAGVGALGVLHGVCGDQLPAETFHNDAINQNFELKEDFFLWKKIDPTLLVKFPHAISMAKHSFVLTLPTKSRIFELENKLLHSQERPSMLEMILGGADGYLRLHIRRSHLLSDTMTYISTIESTNPETLKKRLRVEFVGEEGIDEGGVQKEFFQLIIRDLFDPQFGMFVHVPETHLYWFSPASFETPQEYRLLGILLGIALYNNVILDVRLPSLIYKKLLQERVGLDDLSEINPGLHRGFKELLAYEGDDIEDVFDRTFTVEFDVFGEKRVHELCPGGKEKILSRANREEYVSLYVEYLLDVSVRANFEAFREGFFAVCAGSQALKLFRACEVERLLCGELDLDFEALERATVYDSYTRESPVVKWFWETAHAMTEDEKKALLTFATGSDRVPVGGFAHNFRFIIAKQGADSDRIPSAHTCFNVLLIPEYSNKEKLTKLLKLAITHSQGFGML